MDAKTAAMTPAERLTNHLCPECGDELTDLDAESHAVNHWGERTVVDSRENHEAHVRQKMLLSYHDEKVEAAREAARAAGKPDAPLRGR